MPRKRKQRREQEQAQRRGLDALQKTVNLQGYGEDPAVRALLTQLDKPKTTNVEAAKIMMAVQKLITGIETTGEKRNKILQRAAAMDQDEEKFEVAPMQFIQEVFREADKDRLPPEQEQRRKAELAQDFRERLQTKKADRAVKNLKIEHRIANEPKRDVMVEPRYEMVKVGGQPQRVEVGEVVRIVDKKYVFRPGLNKDVPKIFADRYEEIRRSREETEKRKQAMSKNMKATALWQHLNDIGNEYGSSTPMPGQRERV